MCHVSGTFLVNTVKKNKEENIMYAFRNESHIGTKKQFYISHTDLSDNIYYGVCDHCKIRTDNITTDHFPIPFKTIFEDFTSFCIEDAQSNRSSSDSRPFISAPLK